MSKNSKINSTLAVMLAILMMLSVLPVGVLAADEAEKPLTVTVNGESTGYAPDGYYYDVTVTEGNDITFTFKDRIVKSTSLDNKLVDGIVNTDGSVTLKAADIEKLPEDLFEGNCLNIDFNDENGLFASVFLTIEEVIIPAETLELNGSNKSAEVGTKFTLKAIMTPENTTDKVTWESSDTEVAEVSREGVVTAKSQGEATITAKAGILSATCVVTVSEKRDIVVPDGYEKVTVNAPAGTAVEFFEGEDAEESKKLSSEAVYDHGEIGSKQQYTLVLPEGKYSYRGTEGAKTLGGMAFKVPVEDEYASDGSLIDKNNVITLARINYVPKSGLITQKGQYSVTVLPKDVPQAVVGEQYIDAEDHVVTPFLANAAGNVVTYQIVVDLHGELAKTHSIGMLTNVTYNGSREQELTVKKMDFYNVTAPKGAKVQYFRQNNNFNVTEIEVHHTEELADGTVKYSFPQVDNATYRVSMEGKITRAGYLGQNAAGSTGGVVVTFKENENPQTTKTTAARIENSMIVNVNTQNNLKLSIDETFRLRSYRMWQIIDYDAGNIMIEPDFNYKVISGGEHIELTPVTDRCTGNAGEGMRTNWMDIKGVSEGTAVIEVSYDAIIIGGPTYYPGQFGATEESRKAIVVIQVGETDDEAQLNITSTHGTHNKYQWDSDLSTVYMFGDETDFSFEAKVGNSAPDNVEYSTDLGKTWKTINAENGVYTAKGITPGSTLIRATAGNKVDYQVIKATKLEMLVVNMTRPGSDVIVEGDTIRVMFKNIYAPTPKMSGIYNPGWEGSSGTQYKVDSASVSKSTSASQYGFAADNVLTITFSEAGTFRFTDGCISSEVMGCITGDHRWLTDSGCGVNMNAKNGSSNRCVLPDITFEVIEMPVIDVDFKFYIKGTSINTSATLTVDGQTPDENGVYHLELGTYKYSVTKTNYVPIKGEFEVGADDMLTGKKTITLYLEQAKGKHWDGVSSDEIRNFGENGEYLISNGAELNWYAKNGGGKDARLTADIYMGGHGLSIGGLKGTFDGDGHYIYDFYHTSSLFTGVINGTIRNLGIEGSQTGGNGFATTAHGGVYVTIENCVSRVDLKGGGGFTDGKGQTVINSYYAGSGASSGIIAVGERTWGVTVKNVYNIGQATSYGIGYSTSAQRVVSNVYTLYGSAPSQGVGAWKTETELKALASDLGDAFMDNPTSYNDGYPILDWEEPKALEAAKEEFPAQLDSYKDFNNYYEAQQSELTSAIEAGKTAIGNATTIADAVKALEDAKEAMDNVMTKQDVDDEGAGALSNAKKNAKSDLEGYIADMSKYSEEDQAKIAQEITDGKNAIDSAKTVEEVNQALADAKAKLDEFEEITQPSVLYGDVDGSGTVTVKDATIIRKYIAGTLNKRIDETAADVSGDGKVTVKDATIIRKYAAGTIDKFPVEK